MSEFNRIPGGLAAKKRPSDFDPRALENGIRVEMEHTTDRRIATEIAMDHLTEDPHYYDRAKGTTMQEPAHIYLDQERRRYPVKKAQPDGSWAYDADLIVKAGERARALNDAVFEQRADRLRMERAEAMRKAVDTSWQPKLPMQYRHQFQEGAGYADAQTMAGTEFFEPIGEPSSGVSTVAPMRQFRRHNDGELDYPAATSAIISAWMDMAKGEMLTPIQRALLEVLYPGQMDLMDPFAAEMLTTLAPEEVRALKEATEAQLKERVGYRDGNPKLLPGSTWGTIR